MALDQKSIQNLTKTIQSELLKLAQARKTLPKGESPAEGGLSHLESVARQMGEITQDAKLTGKQKIARLKGLLTELQELSAPSSATNELPRVASFETRSDKSGSQAVAAAAARGAGDSKKLFVLDQRRGAAGEALDASKSASKTSATASLDREASGLLAQARVDSASEAKGSLSALHAKATQGSPFAGALERLREIAAPELVKTAGIVLRDGGDGEIRLVLKPESLGSVRIRMNLVDNVIEGKIIVDTAAAKQLFDAGIDTLTKALAAEGFQTGSLQVAVGGQGSGEERTSSEPSPQARKETSDGFARNVPALESVSLGDLLVNLFV